MPLNLAALGTPPSVPSRAGETPRQDPGARPENAGSPPSPRSLPALRSPERFPSSYSCRPGPGGSRIPGAGAEASTLPARGAMRAGSLLPPARPRAAPHEGSRAPGPSDAGSRRSPGMRTRLRRPFPASPRRSRSDPPTAAFPDFYPAWRPPGAGPPPAALLPQPSPAAPAQHRSPAPPGSHPRRKTPQKAAPADRPAAAPERPGPQRWHCQGPGGR